MTEEEIEHNIYEFKGRGAFVTGKEIEFTKELASVGWEIFWIQVVRGFWSYTKYYYVRRPKRSSLRRKLGESSYYAQLEDRANSIRKSR